MTHTKPAGARFSEIGMSEHYEKGRKAAGEGWADVKTAAYQNGYGCVGQTRIEFIKGYLSASEAAQ